MRKIAALCLWVPPAMAAGFLMVELQPATVAAFDRYLQGAEGRVASLAQVRRLWLDASPEKERAVREGKVLAEPVNGNGTVAVEGGLIQDWVGAMFVPDATLDGVLALVQDYARQEKMYTPDVIRSRVLSREGDRFMVSLRLLKKKTTTVVLDVTEVVDYHRPAEDFAYNVCHATRISEVQDAGKASEQELPPGKDHGFLWRMNSYWRFAQRDGGVYVEAEVITLTRGLPTGLGWLIGPMVRNLPRDGLVQTLAQTREALKGR